MKPTKPKITVYYDGQCPMCSIEIGHLKKVDTSCRIQFEDIKANDFNPLNPELNVDSLDALLHVKDANGTWVKGLDANYLMWKTVGLGKWAAPLKWKWLRPISEPIYRGFTKHRHKIASVFFRSHKTSTKQVNHHE